MHHVIDVTVDNFQRAQISRQQNLFMHIEIGICSL